MKQRTMCVSKQKVRQTEKMAVQRAWGVGKVGKFQNRKERPGQLEQEQERFWRTVSGRGRQILGPTVRLRITS